MATRNREIESRPVAANTVLFDEIEDSGTYFSNWSGHLIRVPDNGLKAGSSPTIDILGKGPMVVTKLSDDPYCTISKARMIAADLDLQVNF
jgi:hypothetical protein